MNEQTHMVVSVKPDVSRRDYVEITLYENGVEVFKHSQRLNVFRFPHWHLMETGCIGFIGGEESIDYLKPQIWTT